MAAVNDCSQEWKRADTAAVHVVGDEYEMGPGARPGTLEA